ncbi:MAG: hypothetical protein QME32_00625, partial [Endomicrobiia bacterium]|nr:hypothetical protein [Endomicrobiia bacterium]
MDKHYSELDKELVRLKSELDIQDEMTNRFTAPVSTNYWQKRLEEEKELWRKRMLTREEEKKTLESQIRRQETHLKEYESKLSGIEKNFERELKNWEEKFRVKEADLLLEKNRILWEEKVKDAESETRQILEKIATLNEMIAHIKDENLADKERMLAHFDEEKRMLNERIAFLESAHENLKNHHIDVKNINSVEEEKLKKEIASRLAEAEALSSEMTAISAERNALKREIDIMSARFAQEKTEIERNRFAAASATSSLLTAMIEKLAATAEYRRRMNMPPGGETKIFAEEAAAVLDSLIGGRSLPVSESKPAVAVLGASARMREISDALADVLAPVAVSSLKDIPKAAPAALVSDDIRMAVKAAAKYPFLPVIVLTSPSQGRGSRIKKPPSNLHIFASDNPAASSVSRTAETTAA